MTADETTAELRELLEQILSLLRQQPQGMSEYELLKALRAVAESFFPEKIFRDNHAMFQAHFLLFHALYKLDDQLRNGSGETVDIDVLKIRLNRLHNEGRELAAKPDPMRTYYLDLDNLHQTSADDVEQLLGTFWVRYYANERRSEALSVLGLSDPVEMETITRRYRELAMRHHPDRGGDKTHFQQLQEAMSVLRRC